MKEINKEKLIREIEWKKLELRDPWKSKWEFEKIRNQLEELKAKLRELVPGEELSGISHGAFGLCKECNQPNTGKYWCQNCNSRKLRQNFDNWTSGNPEIDKFIQKYQLSAISSEQILEWIPYEQLTNIEYLAEGGFGKIYKASWKNKEVVLKILSNSQNVSSGFLQEITWHKLFDNADSPDENIVRCYGISEEPQTSNYAMVMRYINGGSLRQYLGDKQSRLKVKLNQLADIAKGLNAIHTQGLIHRDLHPGNILIEGNFYPQCHITDLGLCQPTAKKTEENVYGVLPYVAPEVLRGQPHTKAADIYSFGIVAYQILSNLPPYYGMPHDISLALTVCDGLRPNLNNILVPQLTKDLISRCWDADPLKRPTARGLKIILNNWSKVGVVWNNYDYVSLEFYQQYEKSEKETEERFQEFCKKHNYEYHDKEQANYNGYYFKKREETLKAFHKSFLTLHKSHPQVVYTSRLLDFKNLPEPRNSKQINEKFYKTRQFEQSLDLSQLNISEDSQEQSSLQAQTEIPPKNLNK